MVSAVIRSIKDLDLESNLDLDLRRVANRANECDRGR